MTSSFGGQGCTIVTDFAGDLSGHHGLRYLSWATHGYINFVNPETRQLHFLRDIVSIDARIRGNDVISTGLSTDINSWGQR